MAEQAGHQGQHTAGSQNPAQQQSQQQQNQNQNQLQNQKQQQSQNKKRQQQSQPRTLQSPPLPNSPPGYSPGYQNQQSYFQPHPNARPNAGYQYQQDYQNQSHSHGHGHGNVPYAAMAQEQGLPRDDYRPSQYPGAQSFVPGSVASNQYPGQQVQVQMQSFYMAQPGMAPQYYGQMPVMVLTNMANVTNMAARQNYAYPSQQTTGFYYATSQYPGPQNHQNHQNHQNQGYSAAPVNYTTAAYPQRRRSQSTTRSGAQGSTVQTTHRQNQEQPQIRPATIVRGPPRKPKQSGHAIWIGNLPPQTELMELVHHVCQQTDGLQSLFLIAKSNCAFANFPAEDSCQAAQQKVNDTWFKSVRLVSRLRKNSVDNGQGITPASRPVVDTAENTENTGNAENAENAEKAEKAEKTQVLFASPEPPKKIPSPSSLVVDGTGKGNATPPTAEGTATPSSNSGSSQHVSAKKTDCYFILKSLTMEDLTLSVRTGVWATQSHNEQVLNAAFNSCDSVYLVFSANKSGEYFGYARMTSEINNDPAAAVKFAPTSHSFSETDLPKAIPTEATDSTPRGRIIDDSARGTIFWEAQSDDGFVGVEELAEALQEEEEEQNEQKAEVKDEPEKDDDEAEQKAWGKPFKLEWQSTARLPFYRTRGLRNPLNANREVKIARDGTEVHAEVGRKLVGLFHQPAATVGSPVPRGGRSGSFSYGGH